VTEEEVAEVVSRWTGIPVSKMLEGERAKLVRMEESLHSRLIGQDEAVTAVANAIRRSRAGLSDPNRPIGSFLFLGPTGVGKTELCKSLAEFLFDSEKALVRIDMSEYMEKHSVSRLIGQLTEIVRRKPYSVVLLDEVEKAHHDVFNILLQVLDDGRLTDGQGRVVDFRNTVVVMTSNLGSDIIQEMAGREDYEVMKAAVLGVVNQHFRPEFINRIDDIVVFHPLRESEIAKIAKIQIDKLQQRLQAMQISLDIKPDAITKLCEAGYDPVYGARPLKRAIQQLFENPLATDILQAKFIPGDIVAVTSNEHGLTFKRVEK
jgi:ATP-dependent Clp protease ATP-binding subunit ClpB